ncbi:Uncharacterized protein OBRU01_11408 [Operophtera brumata]|uniref:Uncharacterized protein n=1 Tax=Operophtera brumata TaxID=104452 RepID=A0A0L7L515_OPEBR|nr:Uncharacterized protein OBRU01_25267 [Operophtera brumata]KOB70505.1 Uncharacterized protein OBRU01_11408 [Operophtera brumata]
MVESSWQATLQYLIPIKPKYFQQPPTQIYETNQVLTSPDRHLRSSQSSQYTWIPWCRLLASLVWRSRTRWKPPRPPWYGVCL